MTTVLTAWTEATGREGRPERKERIWSLAKRSMGSSTAAYVYPYDDEERDKKAWMYVLVKAMAQDLSITEEALRASVEAAGLALEDDVWIDISTPEAANRAAAWIKAVYSKPTAA